MNVFLLHASPEKAARAHCGKHVNKMLLEAVQVANTGLHIAGAEQHAFYQPTHTDHPWCEFAATSFDHFDFIVRRAEALGREFLRRYGDWHTSHRKIAHNWSHDDLKRIERALGRDNSEQVWRDVPQAMPAKYQQDDEPIAAYRAYYRNEKWPQEWCKYEHVSVPEWFDTPQRRW